MKLLRETPSPRRWSFWIAIALLALAAVIQALLPSNRQLFCPWMHWAGFPCPTCGATRCVAAMLHGSISEAFFHQPLFFLIACTLGVNWLSRGAALIFGFRICRVQFESRRERFFVGAVVVVLVVVNWLYVIARYSA